MNLNILRWIDGVFGPVLARLLFIVGLVTGHSRKLKDPLQDKTVEKVLIIKFFGGGSILLASPAIYSIKKNHPNACISIMTLSENQEICSLLTAIDNIYALDLKTPLTFFLKYFKLVRKIKNENYDVIVDLEFVTYFLERDVEKPLRKLPNPRNPSFVSSKISLIQLGSSLCQLSSDMFSFIIFT